MGLAMFLPDLVELDVAVEGLLLGCRKRVAQRICGSKLIRRARTRIGEYLHRGRRFRRLVGWRVAELRPRTSLRKSEAEPNRSSLVAERRRPLGWRTAYNSEAAPNLPMTSARNRSGSWPASAHRPRNSSICRIGELRRPWSGRIPASKSGLSALTLASDRGHVVQLLRELVVDDDRGCRWRSPRPSSHSGADILAEGVVLEGKGELESDRLDCGPAALQALRRDRRRTTRYCSEVERTAKR